MIDSLMTILNWCAEHPLLAVVLPTTWSACIVAMKIKF